MSLPEVNVELPHYPRLTPGLDVLLRRPGEVQFGLDPRHGVTATGLSPALIDLLRTLDGLISTESVLASVADEHVEALRGILGELTRRGLLEEARRPRGERTRAHDEPEHSSLRAGTQARTGRSECSVRIYGGGRAAVATAKLLATAGIGRIDSRCTGTVSRNDLGTGYLDGDIGKQRGRAMADAVHRANPRTSTTRITGRDRPTVAVIADTIVPDPELTRELFASGIVHIPIRVRDGIAIIGPQVVPDRTSCLRCADLQRADRDPCWPTVATQLAGRARPAELSSVHALAALATGQVLRAVNPQDGAPSIRNATLEVDPFEGESYIRPWEPHPDCTCRAFDTYQRKEHSADNHGAMR